METGYGRGRDKNDPGLPRERKPKLLCRLFLCRVQSFRVSQSSATEVRMPCESGGRGGCGRTRGAVMEGGGEEKNERGEERKEGETRS